MGIDLRRLLRLAFAAIVFVGVALWGRPAGAQSWNWSGRMVVPNRPPVETHTGVVLSSSEVVMTYSAHLADHDVPLTSCRAGLPDIATVKVVNLTNGRYLFVSMKPQHTAACASGNQPIALVPIGSDAAANAALLSVTHACCSGAPAASTRPRPAARPRPSARPATVAAAPRPSPSARPAIVAVVVQPSPSARPASVARPSAPVLVPPADWIENQGVFAFVRVRNRDSRFLTIASGEIANCRGVLYGCGRFGDHPVTLAPAAITTLATIMSGDPKGPQFSYRYDASIGAAAYTGGGWSTKHSTDPNVLMSAEQVRAAEAVAVAGINPAQASRAPAQPTYVGPRLTRRGSTRLGIGQRGVAVVRVSIGQTGMPQNVSIVSISNRALVAAALETAVSSSYAPAMRDGRAANADYIATFQFDGSDPAQASTPVWRRGPSPAPVPSTQSASMPRVLRPGPIALPAAPAPSSPAPTAS